MTRRGLLIGGAGYLGVCLLYVVLRSGPRGGDMPFGYELFVWPVMMFPLGLVGLAAPALLAPLSNWSYEALGSYRALDWFVVVGNFLIWSVVGGVTGSLLKRRRGSEPNSV